MDESAYNFSYQVGAPDSGGVPFDWNKAFDRAADVYTRATAPATASSRVPDQTPVPGQKALSASGGIAITTETLLIGAIAIYFLMVHK